MIKPVTIFKNTDELIKHLNKGEDVFIIIVNNYSQIDLLYNLLMFYHFPIKEKIMLPRKCSWFFLKTIDNYNFTQFYNVVSDISYVTDGLAYMDYRECNFFKKVLNMNNIDDVISNLNMILGGIKNAKLMYAPRYIK